MRKTAVDLKSVGVQNEELVIQLLRRHGKLSQSEIRKLANLSSSTSSYIIGRLRKKGLILETNGPSSRRGAKPILIEINPSGCFAVGVEINPSSILIGLFDFDGKLVESTKAVLGVDHSPENVCHCLEINLRGLLSKNNIGDERLGGIGVALSGSVSKDGTVELSSPMGWKSVPLKKILEERLNKSVKIFTTRVRLLAEITIEPQTSYRNVLYLNVGNGVGSHAIIDGHLLHGSTSKSGEIGHIIVDPEGPRCGCGQKGCLEIFISGPAIASRINSAIRNGQGTILTDVVSADDIPEAIIEKWGAAIAEKDFYSVQLRSLVAEHFSRAAAIAINCYDPDVVILGGYVAKECFDFMAEAIYKRFETDVYDHNSRRIKIKAASAGEDALITGAAKGVLGHSIEIS